MRKIFLYILAFFLFPFYPLLKRIKGFSEKVQIGEKVIVIIRQDGKKRRIIDR